MSTRFKLSLMLILAVVAVLLLPLTKGLSLGLLAPVVFGMADQSVSSDAVRALIAWGILDGAGGYKLKFVPKTADYTIVSPATSAGDKSGTVFTNRGAAGAVVFTLPAPAQNIAGVFYDFLGIADQSIQVQTTTADTFILVNDLTADSLAMSTAGHKIGATMRVACDGISWIGWGVSVGDTFTVAT